VFEKLPWLEMLDGQDAEGEEMSLQHSQELLHDTDFLQDPISDDFSNSSRLTSSTEPLSNSDSNDSSYAFFDKNETYSQRSSLSDGDPIVTKNI